MKITFLKVAEKELDRAFEYYETIQNNLGFRFFSFPRSCVLTHRVVCIPTQERRSEKKWYKQITQT
jgi:hypothetical protein